MKQCLLMIAMIILCFGVVRATDYYVDGVHGSNTTGNGTQAMPWQSITHAIAQVTSGAVVHTIYVSDAVYDTTLETFPIMMKNKVSLVGAGQDITILDAKGTETVIWCENVTDKRTRIEEFRITGGKSKLVSGWIRGGGITLVASSPTIMNNIITGNRGGTAGGIMCTNVSSPVIEGNVISNNYGSVGGIHTSKSSNPIIRHNRIERNKGSAGGIQCNGSFPLIEGNTIESDTSSKSSAGGAAISCNFGASPLIVDNTISKNVALQVFGGEGIIQSKDSSPSIERNIIIDNVGSAIVSELVFSSQPIGPTIVNNTIDGNSGDAIVCATSFSKPNYIQLVKNNIISNNLGYGIMESENSTDVQSVQFNLFYNNAKGHYFDEGTQTYTTVALMDSLVQECRWNLEGDPMFVDAANGNYHLLQVSPAINAGAQNSPLDPDGSRADIGALPFFDTSGVPKTPRNLRAVPGNSQVALGWSANIEPDLAYYTIYRSKTSGFTPTPSVSLLRMTKNNGITI